MAHDSHRAAGKHPGPGGTGRGRFGGIAASLGEGPSAPSTSSDALLGVVIGGLSLGLLGATIGAGRGAPRTIEFKDAPSR